MRIEITGLPDVQEYANLKLDVPSIVKLNEAARADGFVGNSGAQIIDWLLGKLNRARECEAALKELRETRARMDAIMAAFSPAEGVQLDVLVGKIGERDRRIRELEKDNATLRARNAAQTDKLAAIIRATDAPLSA